MCLYFGFSHVSIDYWWLEELHYSPLCVLYLSYLLASLTFLDGQHICDWRSLDVVSHLCYIVMKVGYSTCSRLCVCKLCICCGLPAWRLIYQLYMSISFCLSIFFSIHSLLFSLCCLLLVCCCGLLSILSLCCSAVRLSLEIQPNRILLVTIHHMLYPITVEVLHQVFSPHGFVEKIVTFQKSAGQLLQIFSLTHFLYSVLVKAHEECYV